MPKPRIKLSGRQVNYLKAASSKRAWNGAVNRCIKIFRKHIADHYKMYLDSYGRAIIPFDVINKTKKEMIALKK